MVGTTLREIRQRIEQLASDDGRYYVVCARSGERPVPVAGQRFPTRTDAADAARATEQYRSALRQYDPRLPFYDPIVCEERGGTNGTDETAATSGETIRPLGPPSTGDRTNPEPRGTRETPPLSGFCHDVAGAVFESLSTRGHEDVEGAIMETYLAAAEATVDPDALCLVLLETMALELDRRLSGTEQRRLLRDAAANLSPVESAADPVDASLAYLDSLSLIREYGVTRASSEAGDEDVWTVSLRGYAIECGERRFPTLPIGIDILRRTASTTRLGVTEVTPLGDGDWRFVLTNDGERQGGLVCATGGSS